MLMRINILLEAAETGERIYLTSKNRRNTPDRLELKNWHTRAWSLVLRRLLGNLHFTLSLKESIYVLRRCFFLRHYGMI